LFVSIHGWQLGDIKGEHTIRTFVLAYCKCSDSTSNPTPLPSTQLHCAQAFAYVGEYIWTRCALSSSTCSPIWQDHNSLLFFPSTCWGWFSPFIDDFHPKMEVTLDWEAFIYVLVYSPYLFSSDLSPMVYEFRQDYFVPNDFVSGFNLFFYVCGHIVRSVMFHFQYCVCFLHFDF